MIHFGELLKTLRCKHGWSQAKLAARAQVTTRTLQYWEAGQQQPRDVELENLLTTLHATPEERGQVYTLLPDPRLVRLAQTTETDLPVSADILGSLPGIGDLLRAMRLRHAITQKDMAQSLGISRATVLRWEATKTLPSEEDVERIVLLLRAAPEEHASLRSRRLHPEAWAPQLTLEQCREQFELLNAVHSGNATMFPLMDLHTLALKRQVRLLLGQSSEALRLLAKIEMQHGWWLFVQNRMPEAQTASARALKLVHGTLAPETFWVSILNLLAYHAVIRSGRPEDAVQLLSSWLRRLPRAFQYWVLCDLALYSGQARKFDQATDFLHQAQAALSECVEKDNDNSWYFRTTNARVLLHKGKPIEAMNWLPPLPPVGVSRLSSLMMWAEMLLAAGEKTTAATYLSEAQQFLDVMPLRQRQAKLELLTQQL